MKKIIKRIASSIIVIFLFLNLFVFNVSAVASATVSGGEYNVDNNVSVSIKISNDTPIMTAQIIVNYDPAVLKFQSVSGAEATSSSGSINIVDDNFSTATKDVKTGSYTLKFTALAEGTTNVTSQVKIVDKSANTINASGVAKVSVVRSSNANLSSITLSKGSLSPVFNPNVTDYNVKVKYGVDEITIKATPADGKSRVTGGGTFALDVGKNEKFINVTAQDGTRKIYTLNITRMSEQETQEAEQAERDANPLLVVINGNDYKIVNDLANVTIPAGFTKATATRKESEITVLKDIAEKYELCWLVDQNGENGAFYSRDAQDNFTKLIYISVGEKIYIIEKFDMLGDLPEGFEFSNCTIAGNEVESIGYTSEGLKDFNIFNCYINGKNDYYCLDSVDGTMQRALDFSVALQNKDDMQAQTDVQVEIQPQTESKKGISKTGLLVLGLVAVVAILLIVLAIVLIVKIASSNRKDDTSEIFEQFENDFILQDTEEVQIDDIQKQ